MFNSHPIVATSRLAPCLAARYVGCRARRWARLPGSRRGIPVAEGVAAPSRPSTRPDQPCLVPAAGHRQQPCIVSPPRLHFEIALGQNSVSIVRGVAARRRDRATGSGCGSRRNARRIGLHRLMVVGHAGHVHVVEAMPAISCRSTFVCKNPRGSKPPAVPTETQR
jgi:hypothetical protein